MDDLNIDVQTTTAAHLVRGDVVVVDALEAFPAIMDGDSVEAFGEGYLVPLAVHIDGERFTLPVYFGHSEPLTRVRVTTVD